MWAIAKLTAATTLLGFSCMLIGCGHNQEKDDDDAGKRIADLMLTHEAVAQLSLGTSEYQKAILQDGRVTFAEYERAVLASVQCLREKGFEVTGYPSRTGTPLPGPVLSRRGQLEYLPKSRPDSNTDAEDIRDCESRFVNVLKPLWAGHVAPSAEEVAAARDYLSVCLTERGFQDVPVAPTGEQMLAIAFPPDGIPRNPPPQSYVDCAERAATEFDIPGYFGQ